MSPEQRRGEVTAGALPDTAREGTGAPVRACPGLVREHRDAAPLPRSSRAGRVGVERARELRDARKAGVPAFARRPAPRIAAGGPAPLPPPSPASPGLGAGRRRLTVGDVDLDEAARVLPDRLRCPVGAG